MTKVHCRFCEQNFITGNLTKCSLCGKSGGLISLEAVSASPSESVAAGDAPRGIESLKSRFRGVEGPRASRDLFAASRSRMSSSGNVDLDRQEAREGELPGLCMRCGEPAETQVGRTFAWHPPWVWILLLLGLLPFVIVALMVTMRARVKAPLCKRHKNHWYARGLIIGLSLVAVLAVPIVAFAVASARNPADPDRISGAICFGSAILLAAWVILVVVVQLSAIRPTEITDSIIRLTNVSPRFGEALEERAARSWEDYREVHSKAAEVEGSEWRAGPPPDAFEEHK